MTPKNLEVHEHTYISGPNSHFSPCRKVVHSHVGGDVPHTHPECGPSTYTIDKDEWARSTGLKGGGRKKFTSKPTGPQFEEMRVRTPEECTFQVIICNPPNPGPGYPGSESGATGGLCTVDRMVQTFRMTPHLRIER